MANKTKKTSTKANRAEARAKEWEAYDEKIVREKPGTFKYVIKYYLITLIGLMIVWPLLDLIICGIQHKEFQYNVVSHIASPAFWAVILTVCELAWRNSSGKKRK